MTEDIFRVNRDGWRTTLGKLCQLGGGDIQTGPFGSQLHASDYVPVGIPSVMPQDIGDNIIIEDGIARITPKDASRLSRYLLKTGDIVYSRRGDVERRALVRPAQDGWLCGTGCLRVRPGSTTDSQFLSYYLGHPEVRRWIVRHAIGATMPNLNTKILSSLPVTVPSVLIQKAIGIILGTLDNKKETCKKIARSCDELRSLRLVQHLTGSVEPAAEKPLSSVAEFVNGRAFTKNATGTGRMVVRIAEINSCPGASTVYNDINVPDQHLVRPGDILFSWSGSLSVKRWFRQEAIINQHIFKVLPRVGIPKWLAFELTKAKLDQFRMIAAGKATTMGHIQRHHLNEPVTAPADGDVARLDESLGPLWDCALAAEREALALAELRDMLLPKLMSGELRVRDAEKVVEEVT